MFGLKSVAAKAATAATVPTPLNFERIACKTECIFVHPKEETQHDIKLAFPLLTKDGHF